MFFKNSLFVFHEKKKKRKKLKEVRNNMRVNDRMMTHKIINKNNFRWPVPLNTNRGKIRADLIRIKTDKNYIYVYKRQRYSLNNCYIPVKRWNVIFTELEFSRRCLLYIKCRKTVSPEEVHNGAQRAQKQQCRIVITVKVYSLHFYAWCM